VDVVMNDGFFTQSCYDTVMVHEIGHTLGFRHSNQNDTSDGPCVAAPSITEQPVSVMIRAGTRASFGVGATGTLPLQYQWYQGAKGDTNDPVGSSQPGYVSAPLFGATSYWVHVSNACGSVDSEAAIVTLFPGRRRAVGHP
jgi:hypothetical protein